MPNINPTTPALAASITITIAGAAAASSKTVGVSIDNAPCQYTTTISQSAADAAVLLGAAVEAALPTYTVSVDGAVVTVAAPAGRKIFALGYSTDATQLIAVTGGAVGEAMLAGVSTAGTGRPTGQAGGFQLPAQRILDAGSVTVSLRVALRNVSGSSRTAYWRLWRYSEELGWTIDPYVSGSVIIDAGSSVGFATSSPIDVALYASKVAVELIGSTATGTDLGSGATLWAWGEVI